MFAGVDLISVLHIVLLFAFVGATSVSMLVALINRLRVKRSLLVWQERTPARVPLGPALFLACVAAGLGTAAWVDYFVPAAVVIGYPAGGLFWLVAAWIGRTVVVTEYGIIHDVNRISRAVAWGRIVDYFSTTRNGQPHFVFFYLDDEDRRRRLDLPVPKRRAAAFREAVARKLDARFRFSADRLVDEETLGEQGGDPFGSG
jgi:hypothetical protein